MAYKLKTSEKIIEELELSNGEVVKAEIQPGLMAKSFMTNYNLVISLTAGLENIKPQEGAKYYSELGAAIVTLMQDLIGEDSTSKILEDYSEDYLEITVDFMGWVQDVIMPHMKNWKAEKAAKAHKYEQMAKMNKR